MKKILQISIEVNSNSVGKIAEQIGETIIKNGWFSYITYARNFNPSKSITIRIGNKLDVLWHVLETRLFDNHGFSSRIATYLLIKKIKKIKPDLIHLHHIHGYYINIKTLINYLKTTNIPIVWTFHDCWAFTGHCAYFDFVNCSKWVNGCFQCEQKHEYPKSILLDNSKKNYLIKSNLFNSLDNLTIVPVSNWLGNLVAMSFLKSKSIEVIKNGIDLDIFYPHEPTCEIPKLYNLYDKFVILGVASTWDNRKGLSEFYKLNKMLDEYKYKILLVGLTKKQILDLPLNIIGIEKTENVEQLAKLYSFADVFVNPTFEDTYPTTNLESIACGTPVITYNTGGSIESVNIKTGFIVDKYDINSIFDAIKKIELCGKSFYTNTCRLYALNNFNKNDNFNSYIKLYDKLLN
jgi:putative colanic acid biosynthesis glycosyltransferase